MINTKNKNKFVRVSLIVFACILGAMLLFMPFLLKDKRSVFADSTTVQNYSFDGSNILFGMTARDIYNSNNDTYYTSNYSIMSFKVLDLQQDVNNSSNFSFTLDSFIYFIPRETKNYFTYWAYNSNTGDSYSFPMGASTNFYSAMKTKHNNANNMPYFYCWVYCPVDFNFNIQSVRLESYLSNSNVATNYTFYIKYNDSNGATLTFSFDNIETQVQPVLDSNPTPSILNIPWTHSSMTHPNNFANRTYLFDSVLGGFTDNSFYQQGLTDGYNNGYSVGDSEGYDRGYTNGYNNGESAGYNDGLSAGSNVSFTNLIGSTVDVPVKTMNSLLDFNLPLGDSSINLKGFLISVLTVALIIAFVRFILAKK